MQVAEEPSYWRFRHDSAAHFVRYHRRVRPCRGCRHAFHLPQRSDVDILCRNFAMLPAEITEPERQAVEQEEVAIGGMPFHNISDFERLFDRDPMSRPLLTMPADARRHFGILRTSRGNIHDSLRVDTQGLRKTALAAASAADHQREHGEVNAPPNLPARGRY